ncbi:MAG: ABC transporter permease [Anaerolineae bacterium]|nr:ABC transporter permease [Anaerolineae bacterium]
MIGQYVLRSFRRRRVRTFLMVLSLVVSTGLIVAMGALVETLRRSTVDLITAEMGRPDLTVQMADTSPEPFLPVAETSGRILAADPRVESVHPRFLSQATLIGGGAELDGWMLALDPAEGIGQVEVISGTYQLGDMQAALLEGAAKQMRDLRIGDTIEVHYAYPQPREKGSVGAAGASQRRVVGRLTISGIVTQNGVATAGINDGGLIVHLADAQALLGLPDRAGYVVAMVSPAMYEAGNAETAALGVRDVALHVQAALGEPYVVRANKAGALDEMGMVFMILQAMISVYGLMSLSVVGLLVYTLVMTNVQEQRREMAILRIIGGQRKILFGIVLADVLAIGVLGVGLGALLGQAITTFGVVPLIEYLARQQDIVIALRPTVSLMGILPAVVSAFGVLLISAIRPAQEAARTKVVHAINPGVADNIQLEDLEKLRERRPSLKLFLTGLVILLVVLLLNSQSLAEQFGIPVAEAAIFLATLILMILGLAALFFVFTRPLEKLVLAAIGLLAPRLTYFAARNVARTAERNTLISALVLLSGVLPSFLATQSAISNANVVTDVRLNMGAPVRMQTFSRYAAPELASLSYLKPSFVDKELRAVPGIGDAVGLTYERRARVQDLVGMRSGSLTLVGVAGDLSRVLHPDLAVFAGGDIASLARLQADPHAVIISQGMAEGLAIPLGGVIVVEGQGLDHREELTVVGIAQRLPGFHGIGRVRSQALDGGTALVSLEAFRRLTTDPREPLPPPDDPILRVLLTTVAPGADPVTVEAALHEAFSQDYGFWTRVEAVRIQRARQEHANGQIFLLVLTLLSFVTAVFGVFAVIYVTIYARRREIGMMKAIGARNRELNGMLSVESIAMALSAALAGILAGATMGYVFALVENAMAQRPQRFTLDTTVMPAIIVLVTAASILGSILSARRIVKRKAVEILRMS